MKPADLTSDIIRRLLESFIDHTRDLHVEPAGDDQLIEWLIEVHQDDQRKVIGAKGSHIKALKFIVSELGLAVGADYRLKLRDRPTPEFPERSAPKLAKAYDVTAAATLLADLLIQLTPSNPGKINVVCTNGRPGPKNPLAFSFIITPSEAAATVLAKQDEAGDQTLLGAVGTIFRAYANREGVAFKLEVAP